MGGCVSKSDKNMHGIAFLAYVEDFENLCCHKRPGAAVRPSLYKNALFNYIYFKMNIDGKTPEPRLRSFVHHAVFSFEPPLISQGGWRQTTAGSSEDQMWCGIEIDHFPSKAFLASSGKNLIENVK